MYNKLEQPVCNLCFINLQTYHTVILRAILQKLFFYYFLILDSVEFLLVTIRFLSCTVKLCQGKYTTNYVLYLFRLLSKNETIVILVPDGHLYWMTASTDLISFTYSFCGLLVCIPLVQ